MGWFWVKVLKTHQQVTTTTTTAQSLFRWFGNNKRKSVRLIGLNKWKAATFWLDSLPPNLAFFSSSLGTCLFPPQEWIVPASLWYKKPLLAYPGELNQNRLEILSGESLWHPTSPTCCSTQETENLNAFQIYHKSFMPEKILTIPIHLYTNKGRGPHLTNLQDPPWASLTECPPLPRRCFPSQLRSPSLRRCLNMATRQWQRGT